LKPLDQGSNNLFAGVVNAFINIDYRLLIDDHCSNTLFTVCTLRIIRLWGLLECVHGLLMLSYLACGHLVTRGDSLNESVWRVIATMLGERTWQLLRHVSFSSLAVLLFISDSSAERTEPKYLTCRNCPGTNPKCWKTCRGLYCYKAEFFSEGESTVNSGCLNLTDRGVRINECEENTSVLPGSATKVIDRLCICTSDKCNVTTPQLISALLVFCIAFFLFCL
uniref:Activin_recp domain-containing protein n=1 Tax=Ascaris lumbricoides TaxID=6252 RepID=A0A0M3HY30_ASCLU